MGKTEILPLLLAAALSFLFSFLLTPPAKTLAGGLGAIDLPDGEKSGRRIHKKPTPRLGGLAIFLSFFFSTALFADGPRELAALWLGGLLTVMMGVLDDVFGLKPWAKLCFQTAAALTAVLSGIRIGAVKAFGSMIHPGVYSAPLTVLWIVTLTNALNLIDGLDGLACGIASVSALSLSAVSMIGGDLSRILPAFCLAFACLGFLPYNRTPASVFMGDTGAQFLGFALGVLSVPALFGEKNAVPLIVPLLIFALPVFETFFSFFRRMKSGMNPFRADRGHLHHRLLDRGFAPGEVTAILTGLSALFGAAAVLYLFFPVRALLTASSGAVILILYLAVYDRKRRR